MSSILRALRTLPIYVVTGKTKYNSFDADAAVPAMDTGTRNDLLNAGGALGVTQITDITGLTAWKDYIPVQNETGRTVPFSYGANGYFPIKKASGAIFELPEPPITGTLSALMYFMNADTTQVFVEETGKALTVVAESRHSSVTSKWHDTSCWFDGTGDYIDIANSADFAYGSGDFTIEMWVRQTSGQSANAFLIESYGSNPGSVAVTCDTNGAVRLYASTNGSTWDLISGASVGTLAVDTWALVTVCRVGTNIYAFKDGVLQSTSAVGTSSIITSIYATRLGGPGFKGYFGGLRIIKGQGLYDANFSVYTSQFSNPQASVATVTLASLAYGLHFDGTNGSTTFTDVDGKTWTASGTTALSTAQAKFGTASLLPGTSAYISTPDHADFALDSGDFTWSAWLYPTASTQGFIYADYDGSYGPLLVQMLSTRQLQVLHSTGGVSWDLVMNTNAITLNTWTHLEVSRRGNVIRTFVNGVYVRGVRTTASLLVGANTVLLGGQTSSLHFPGYIDDAFLSKGIGQHNASFTPATSAFSFS